ncbi:MAG TPA: tetratricopeptide repeat protein [Aggregatilineales bacterium]|nr:tetratricopeptide repeat protein [Aggregatilineales bacterium]
MRRLLLLLVLLASGLGVSGVRAQTSKPTPTSTPTPLPLSVTVLVARFDTTGVNLPAAPTSGKAAASPLTPASASTAIVSALGKLSNPKVKVQSVSTAFKTAGDARAAGTSAGAGLVIWGTVEQGIFSVHYEMLSRGQFAALDIQTKENRTHTGLYLLPDAAMLPLSGDLRSDIVVNFSLAQVELAVAHDVDAQAALRAAGDAASAAAPADSAEAAAVANEIEFQVAYLNALANRLDTAIQNFQDILNNTPRDVLGLTGALNTGALAINKGDYSLGARLLGQVITADPTNVLALTNRGTAYRWLGNSNLAFADYNAALKLDPSSVLALNNRGWLYLDAGQFDSALADLNRAVTLDPRFVDAYLGRVIIRRQNQQYSEALDDSATIISLDPKYEPGYRVRASLYIRIGQYDQAIADLNTALSLAPDDDVAYQDRGFAYLRLSQPDRAIADLTAAIAISPSDPFSYLARCEAYLRLGQFENTILDATQALTLDTQGTAARGGALADAYYLRAEAYAGLQRYGEAARDYTKYLQVAPSGFYASAAKGRLAGIKILVTVTPTSTRTPSRTPTATLAASSTPTKTPTPIPSNTPTASQTPLPTRTSSPTNTPTIPPTRTPTATGAAF